MGASLYKLSTKLGFKNVEKWMILLYFEKKVKNTIKRKLHSKIHSFNEKQTQSLKDKQQNQVDSHSILFSIFCYQS